ncbi:MAG: histidine kinase dimerization/phosphoacceptor domain-containing protein, partial [Arthrobacter sp.]|nr:histidine kinase dimerization/phosphoacceptor domain-containing protein [Arthrobacter sp.]
MISSLQASPEVSPRKHPADLRTVAGRLRRSWLVWTPSCAALFVLAGAFVVEGHRFDRGLSVSIALSAALAAAPLVPWPAAAFAGAVVLGQSLGVVPGPFIVGVWGYGAIPLLLFVTTLTLLRQHGTTTATAGMRPAPRPLRFLRTPPTSTALAGSALCLLIATACTRDDIWMAYYFPPVVGDGRLRPLVYWVFLFLMAGAACLAAWGAAVVVHRAQRSEDAQLKAEATVQAQGVELALQSERERISRELHDILAHSLTVVTAQAEGIRYIALQEPETARESAEVIASVSRAALRDVRRLLETEAGQDAPAPGLQDLPDLLDRFRSSEMPVRLEQDAVSLSPAQELAVYRVVQE